MLRRMGNWPWRPSAVVEGSRPVRYNHKSLENRRRASFLLGKLKSQLVDASGAVEHAVTMQAATSSPHWRLSNVTGVHVYSVPGGWNADLSFEDLPLGVPSVIGNAVPCASRQEAFESAVRQLSLCAEREKAYLPGCEDRFRWFVFEEVEVPIDPDYLSRVALDLARDGYDIDQALEELTQLRREIAGDGPLNEGWLQSVEDGYKERLCVVCEKAMALGRTQFSLASEDYAPGPFGALH